MLERIINPRNTESGTWKMFFVGLIYGSLSLLLVHWFFSSDPALSKASGMIVICFCIMFSLPFMYFLIRREEQEDEEIEGVWHVWKAHSDAIFAFMWLFLGFVVAFSFWHITLKDPNLLNFQINAYCQINSADNVNECLKTNGIGVTGALTGEFSRVLSILENNVYVMIFTLIFSLIFGAGAIFVLAWNASVIAAAIGIFTNNQVTGLPLGLARYMIHGFPEISAYFITALAGGIFGVGAIRHGIKSRKFVRVLENTFILLFLSIIILILAAIMEVYITPNLF